MSRARQQIDVFLGEWSELGDATGFYVQGVSRTTAILPTGWQDRLIRVDGGDGTTGLCLKAHDLCEAKLTRF